MRRAIENLILSISENTSRIDNEDIIYYLFEILKGTYFDNVVWEAGLGLLEVIPEAKEILSDLVKSLPSSAVKYYAECIDCGKDFKIGEADEVRCEKCADEMDAEYFGAEEYNSNSWEAQDEQE